jgi:hypothetical protein
VSNPGWVYVLTNPALPRRCCKIGGTGRTATHRKAELVREYGAPAPWEIASRHVVADWLAVEQAAHRMLSDRRLPRSELFEVSPREAARVIRAAAAAYRRPWGLTAWLRRLTLPRPARGSYTARYRRRGSRDGLLIGGLLLALAGVVWLLPDVPAWLPDSVIRTVLLIEGHPR